MKISRSVLGSAFVILLIISALVVGFMYKNASADRTAEQGKIDTAQLTLTVLNKQKADLAPKLVQAAADVASWNDKIALLQTTLAESGLSLKQIQAQFPPNAATIEYNDTLTTLARSCNLTMSTIVATVASKADISTPGFTFNTNVFTISVSGKVSDILSFVDKIATSTLYKTGAITPVSFAIPLPFVPEPLPLPLTQTEKEQLRAKIKTDMINAEFASITGGDRDADYIGVIEQCLLDLLGNGDSSGLIPPTMTDQMTWLIYNRMLAQFGPSTADLLSKQIALAIEHNLANSLISTIANTYSAAISDLFIDNTGNLLPRFTDTIGNNKVGAELTSAIQGIPMSEIPGVITQVITDKLNAMVSASIAARVNEFDIDIALKTAIDAAQKAAVDAVQKANADALAAMPLPTAQLTVAVYSYKGA